MPRPSNMTDDGSGTLWMITVKLPAPPFIPLTLPTELILKSWPPPSGSKPNRLIGEVQKSHTTSSVFKL